MNRPEGRVGKAAKMLVRGARQLLTLRGPDEPRRGTALRQLSIIPDGALLIVNGTIRDVGPSRRVERLAEARDAIELDASGKVVMPGFIDSHTMLLSPRVPLDDYEDRCAAGRFSGPDRSEAEALSAQRMYAECGKRLRQFLRCGTTTVESGAVPSRSDAARLRALRVLKRFEDTPVGLIRAYGGPAETFSRLRRNGLAQLFSIDLDGNGEAALDDVMKARLLNFAVQLIGCPQLAADSGAFCVAGSFRCGHGEIRALQESPCVVALTPAVDLFRGNEFMPARKLVDEGAAVALATGFGVGASPTWSMPAVIALACLLLRLTPAEAICAATINAAFAVGVGRRLGSLEHGKDADVLLMNAGDYREMALLSGDNPVAAVLRRGEVVFSRMGTP